MSLLAFPADRRTSDIRRCAKALLQLNGEEANRFWRSEMASFAGRLTAQGIDEGEISQQAALFMHAVQTELQLAFAIDELNASA